MQPRPTFKLRKLPMHSIESKTYLLIVDATADIGVFGEPNYKVRVCYLLIGLMITLIGRQ